jgi:hypothetical protein
MMAQKGVEPNRLNTSQLLEDVWLHQCAVSAELHAQQNAKGRFFLLAYSS